MACDKSFSSGYLLLSPEKVGLVDLFRILIHSDVHKRKFVDSSKEEGESFRQRWIMFVSILAQKLLLLVAEPMSWIGSKIEFWLNLLSSNQNLGGLLVNCLRGTVEMPDPDSGSFLSIIGNLDKRVELDNPFKPGDSEYYAALSMMASKASYENKAYLETTVTNHWKMKFLGFYNFWNDYLERETTQAFMLRDRDTIVVAFRGTEPFNADDWCSDIDLSWYELGDVGKIHGGFMKALGLQKNQGWPKPRPKTQRLLAYYTIREKLRSLLGENDGAKKYVLTGHSLGGALAILFPAILHMHEETWLMERLEGVYTFGQPRVGDEKFGKFMERVLEERKIKYYRFVYGNDIVPRLPYSAFMFKHFGRCCHFDSKYQGKVIFEEEPNKNYLLPLHMILMMMNACYELIRSFTIHREFGPAYREGLLLRTFRVIGLLIPGIPAHSPQDYVNATRLGGPQLFRHQQ